MTSRKPTFAMPQLLMGCLISLCAASFADAEMTIVSDFDDLSLSAGGHWSGPDPGGTDVIVDDPWTGGTMTITVGSFHSAGVAYVNRYNNKYKTWDGFAYSNMTDTTTGDYTNQFSAFPGTGYGPGSDNYGVAYGYLDSLNSNDVAQLMQLPYLELPEDAKLESARIPNTTYAALTMLNGDEFGFAQQFGGKLGNDPDWFKLSVYGTDAEGNVLNAGVPLDLFLADFRFADNSLDYVLDTWELLDLTPLEDARRVYFNLSSSDAGEFGMNTPALFAIDDVTYSVVPEPSALVLWGLGMCLLGGVSWRRCVREFRAVHSDNRPSRPAGERSCRLAN